MKHILKWECFIMGIFSFNNYIISEKNLKHNVACIKAGLNDGVKFCAVVKADAYGVGAGSVVKILDGEVDAFAVANLWEGIQIRNVNKESKILVLGCINLDEIECYSRNFLTPTVSTVSEIRKLSSEVKIPLSVEFGLNSGMNRIGFCEKCDILTAISILNKNKKINISGAYSHLATKQNDMGFMYEQKKKFDELLTAFRGMNICRHLSNTSASLMDRNFNYDMVRVGYGMYGMGKFDKKLRRAIRIETRVVMLNSVKKGESVGYDRTYVADSQKMIAVLPIGYYDGFGRGLSNRGSVLVNGEFAPVVGRVCMDMMMVDVTDIANVEVGTKAVIIGSQGEKEITLADHAEILGTSDYEVLSRFNNSRMNIIIENF